jgi:hypothetical protein
MCAQIHAGVWHGGEGSGGYADGSATAITLARTRWSGRSCQPRVVVEL